MKFLFVTHLTTINWTLQVLVLVTVLPSLRHWIPDCFVHTAYIHRISSVHLPKSLAAKQGNLNATIEVHFFTLLALVGQAFEAFFTVGEFKGHDMQEVQQNQN